MCITFLGSSSMVQTGRSTYSLSTLFIIDIKKCSKLNFLLDGNTFNIIFCCIPFLSTEWLRFLTRIGFRHRQLFSDGKCHTVPFYRSRLSSDYFYDVVGTFRTEKLFRVWESSSKMLVFVMKNVFHFKDSCYSCPVL